MANTRSMTAAGRSDATASRRYTRSRTAAGLSDATASRRNIRSRTAAGPLAGIPHTYNPADDPWPKYERGTTTLAFILKNREGVMVAVDHPSLPSGGFPEEVVLLNSHLLATIAGGSEVSSEYFLHDLPKKCQQLELEEGRKASAAEASAWVSEFMALHPDSDEPLTLGVLIAGFESGPSLYKVDGKGKLDEVSFSGIGSGSYGRVIVMPRRKDFRRTYEAKELAKRAICVSVYRSPERDAFVSVYHVGSAGITPVVESEDLVEFQKQHFGPKWRDPNTVDWDSPIWPKRV